MMKHSLAAWLLLLATLLAAGCGAEPDPREVAEEFWQGVLRHDADAVRAASDLPENAALTLLDDATGLTEVRFDAVTVQGMEADVATHVTVSRAGSLTFTTRTYLKHDGKRWRVSYNRTFEQFQSQLNLALAIENFDRFGDTLSAGIEQGLKALEQGLPVVEQQLRNVDRALRERLPVLRQQLEEFSRRLDETLKMPPATPEQRQPPKDEAESKDPDAVSI